MREAVVDHFGHLLQIVLNDDLKINVIRKEGHNENKKLSSLVNQMAMFR